MGIVPLVSHLALDMPMTIKVLYALQVYAIGRDALDCPFTTVHQWFAEDAAHMHMNLEAFADVVLHDAAQDIKLGHSYGMFDAIVAEYYNIY